MLMTSMYIVVSKGVVYWNYIYKEQAIKRKEELKEQGLEASVIKC